jgi:hypothetical protein
MVHIGVPICRNSHLFSLVIDLVFRLQFVRS